MDSAKQVRDLFAEYVGVIDESLRSTFKARPEIDMYGHMAYFMGFRDENLEANERYGGKRFRSALALMLADWYGNKEAGLTVATSVELFHNFTLIHDDIVDGDTYRRGYKTVWNLFGMPHAINSGDGQALLAYKALADAYQNGVLTDPAVQSFLFEQYQRVIEGQYFDFVYTDLPLGDTHVNEEAYLDMSGRKTSDLIAAATKGGALAASAPKAEAEALFTYGHSLGLAYQICDDVVSIWASEEKTGKRARGDIIERKKTLPILHAYKHLPEARRRELVAYYNDKEEMKPDRAEAIVGLLDAAGTYEAMKTEIARYADEAKIAAASLSLPGGRQATLATIVDALLPDIKAL